MPLFCRRHRFLSVSTAHCLCVRRTTSDSVFIATAPLPLFPTLSPPLFPPQPPPPPPPKRSYPQVDWRQRRSVAADTMAMAKPLGRRGLFYEFYLPEKLGRNNYCAFFVCSAQVRKKISEKHKRHHPKRALLCVSCPNRWRFAAMILEMEGRGEVH
jgi:hypothetical protein